MIKRVLAIDEFETTLTYKGKTQYTVYFKSSPFLGSMNLNGVSPWIVVYYGIIVAQLSISHNHITKLNYQSGKRKVCGLLSHRPDDKGRLQEMSNLGFLLNLV